VIAAGFEPATVCLEVCYGPKITTFYKGLKIVPLSV